MSTAHQATMTSPSTNRRDNHRQRDAANRSVERRHAVDAAMDPRAIRVNLTDDSWNNEAEYRRGAA